MERLTTCSEISPETDMTQEWGYSHIYKRLATYEDAEEQGRLVVLPCKVGVTIYILQNYRYEDGKGIVYGWNIQEEIVSGISVYDGLMQIETMHNSYDDFAEGIDWFLTREEAEAALNNLV